MLDCKLCGFSVIATIVARCPGSQPEPTALRGGLSCFQNPNELSPKEGANKRGNSSRLTQSFHFFMFEPIFSPVNALNQPV